MFSTVFTKTLRDQARGLLGWGTGVAATVGLMVAIWPSFSDVDYSALLDQYPDAMKEVFNIADMGTPEGFLNAELFSLVLPAMFIVFATGRASRLIAGEEEDGTLEILVSMPLPRWRILIEKAAALVVSVAALALVLAVSTWVSTSIAGMDVALAHAANASLAMFLLGAEFALLALALSASTGRRSLTVGLSSTLAGAAYLLYLLGQLVPAFAPYLELSPFYQAISVGPLGPQLPLLVLAMPAVGLFAIAVSVPVFGRRDLSF